MPEVDRITLSSLIEEVSIGIGAGDHGDVEAIGLEVSAETASAERVAAVGHRVRDRDKPVFQKLARALRKERDASAVLKDTGYVEVDLRERKLAPDVLPAVRYFYAHEVEVRVQGKDGLPPFRLRGWAFSSQRSSTPFSPLALRSALAQLEGMVVAAFAHPSGDVFALAVNRGALRAALGVLGRLHPTLDGFVLWHYDETHRRYKSLASVGTGDNEFNVPVSRSHQEKRTGVVSQIMPDRRAVIYDNQDPNLWKVLGAGDDWEPFDKGLFGKQGWRSCIAIPITSAGRLAGALSAYSAQSAAAFDSLEPELVDAAARCGEAILAQRDKEVIAAMVSRYDEELLTANISLAALSLSHDVLHLNRAVTKFIRDGEGYLDARRLRDAKRELEKAKSMMARTEPTIEAMQRLATEARTSESKEAPQETPNVNEVLTSLAKLLKAILPHFSKDKELQSDAVIVSVKGDPQTIPVDSLTLERIVLNLCVNAAQWRASHVWVTGHFDRSDEEFQLVVRDDGRGISAAARDRVFDRFFSGRGGSGLGLYVVKSLVTRSGGEVYLQSYDHDDDVGRTGTVVTVSLPTTDQASRA
ncbi:MAG: sensor histidine kinase [Terriglobales bacterium]